MGPIYSCTPVLLKYKSSYILKSYFGCSKGVVYGNTALAGFQQTIPVVESLALKLFTVVVRVSVAARKQHDQKASWRGKRLFSLHLHVVHY